MAESQEYFSLILCLMLDLFSNYWIYEASSLDGGVLDFCIPEDDYVESIRESVCQCAEKIMIPFGFLGSNCDNLLRAACTQGSLPEPPPWKMYAQGI